MPRERDERQVPALLWNMLDAALAVQGFVQGRTRADYASDRMLRSAVERCVEIIGEAAGGVPAAFRELHPEVPWRRIVAQRNALVHAYGAVDDNLMWRLATVSIPQLIALLQPLLPQRPDELA